MYFVLLCADILTLCFTGWVILIWKCCFSSCWLESLPKEKAGNFQGFFLRLMPALPCVSEAKIPDLYLQSQSGILFRRYTEHLSDPLEVVGALSTKQF